MEQRITIVTLGVANLERSTEFFERLGWRRSMLETESISFFQCGGIAFALYPRSELAKDVGLALDGAGPDEFTLAYNVRSKDDVDAVLVEVEAAGAKILKPAQDVFWGGCSGYFSDLDGYLWEVAWNPHFQLDEAGAVQLPP